MPARAAKIYPEYGLNRMKYLMRGRRNGNPYCFSRNDVTEAAKLYYNMKNLPRYRIESGFGGIHDVDTPVLSRSGSNSSRRGSRKVVVLLVAAL